MDNSHHNKQLDLVVDYSNGLLSVEQEKVLLATARANPELEAMLRAQCPDFEGFGHKAKAAAARRAAPAVVADVPSSRQRRVWILSAGVAASLALAMWLAPGQESPQYWVPVDDVLVSQRSLTTGMQEMSNGIKSYAEGDLSAAIEQLQMAPVQGANKDLRDIYLVSALFNKGRFDDARKVINNMDLETLPSPWRNYGSDLFRLLSDE